MASIAEQISGQRRDILRYQALKSQLSTVITKLSSATSYSGSLDYEVKSSFKVNNESAALATRTARLDTSIQNTASYLSHTILPAIDAAIGQVNRQIANLEAEARRQAAEEARRRREEEQKRREAEAKQPQEAKL